MNYMINNHRTSDEWKIYLKVKINFVSTIDDVQNRLIDCKSDNVEISGFGREIIFKTILKGI